MKARIVVLTLAVIMLCHSVLNAQETEISESARQTPETSRKTVFFPLIIREECESLKNLPEDEDLSLKSGEIDSARQVRARGNAKPEDVLKDKTFSNRFENYLIGTMPNNGQGSDITCGASDQTIASGYWSTANTVKGDADLVSGNIRSGVNIFGVTGTSLQPSGTATAGDVLSGKTFSNNSGVDIAGTMPDNGEGGTITPTTINQPIAKGYWSSANTVQGDQNLDQWNVRSGVTIFGVTGKCHRFPATGQTTEYAVGDDGTYQYGCRPLVEPKLGAAGGNFNRTNLPWSSRGDPAWWIWEMVR